MKLRSMVFLLFASTIPAFAQESAPLGRLLGKYYPTMRENDEATVWVYFRDKGPNAEQQLALPAHNFVTERSIQRRQKALKAQYVVDSQDLPLDRGYVSAVATIARKFRHEVKWFNTVSVIATREQIEQLRRLPFVSEVELVARFRPVDPEALREESIPMPQPQEQPLINYGNSLTQNHQIKTDSVHLLGITGQGVLIGVFDAGFSNLSHPALVTRPILARFDFQRGDTILTAHSHGQNTFSTVGGFSDGNLIGPAYGATFLLARTEVDPGSETPAEEDNWARAIIWAESLGIDVSSTSLGYLGFDPPWPGYTWQDMNGNTTVITRAADRAAALGIVVVNSAGNAGDPQPPNNSLGAPSDGFNVIAVGAVNSGGTRVSFSSVGPSADGRIKPDVMAMGSSVWVASGASGYGSASGTSFSCPLSAGVAALVLSGNLSFNLTPFQVREAMRQTATQANNPNREYGWGILNALKAVNYPWIEHTPLTDSEDTTAQTVTVTIKSRVALVPDSTIITYGIGGAFTGSALLTATGNPNEYSAQIPYLGSGTVRYYIKAKNSHVTNRLPLTAPTEFFTYNSGTDVTPPVILHTPLGNKSITSWPARVSATVTDNTGVDTVRVEFFLNGQPRTPFDLYPEANAYSEVFPLGPGQVNVGDSIAYRIVAIDASNQANTTMYPASGYIGFVLMNYSNVNEPFEPGSGSFTPTNDWQWGTPSGTSPPAHSDPKCWATILAGNYTVGPRLSSLTTPTYTVFSDRASFSFWQWHEEQTRFDGGNVKISINGGSFQVVNPVGGYYVASLHSGLGNPLAGQPAFSDAAGGVWALATFDLSGIVTAGNTIGIRFDFGADNSIQYRGWYLDDFLSDGFGTIIPTGVTEKRPVHEFALEQNYPNPFNPTTSIRYHVAEPGLVSLKIFNLLGQEVAALVNEMKQPGIFSAEWNAEGLPSGVYFYRISVVPTARRDGQAGSFVQTRKLVLLK